VSVSTAIVLPNAAATFVPLAGDGLSAPFAMYNSVQTVIGDGSGGIASLICTLDTRYCSMVQYVAWTIAQATSANINYGVSISAASNGSSTRIGKGGIAVSIQQLSQEVEGYWSPPATILGPSDGSNPAIGLNFTNVDTDTYVMSTQILLWDINVRNLTAYQMLVGSKSGPGSQGGDLST